MLFYQSIFLSAFGVGPGCDSSDSFKSNLAANGCSESETLPKWGLCGDLLTVEHVGENREFKVDLFIFLE